MEILFIAPVDRFSVKDTGYGTAAAGISSVLLRMKEEKRIRDIHYLNTVDPHPEDIPDHLIDVAICMVHPNSFLQPTPVLSIIMNALMKAKQRFLSVVWETVPLPSGWNGLFASSLFHAFISPSYFVAASIRKMCNKPVYYYPHYINIDEIPAVDIKQKKNEDIFTVLYIGQYTKRKGLEDAVVAFIRALGETPDTRLILKYHPMTDREINPEQLIYHTVATNSLRPKSRVYTITTMLDRKEIVSLYRVSSVLFLPSRGEGFGLPIAEAMAAGISAIYTGWSSMPEIGRAPGNRELDFILDESAGMFHHGYAIGSQYAVPLVSDCMSALTQKYHEWKQDKEHYYLTMKDNRAIIEQRFGYRPVSACIEHFITGQQGFAPQEVEEGMRHIQPVSGRAKPMAVQ